MKILTDFTEVEMAYRGQPRIFRMPTVCAELSIEVFNSEPYGFVDGIEYCVVEVDDSIDATGYEVL